MVVTALRDQYYSAASPIRFHACSTCRRSVLVCPTQNRNVKRSCNRVWLMNNLPEAFTRSRILLVRLVAAAVAEADEVQRGRRGQLKARIGLNPTGQLLGQGHVLPHALLNPFDAEPPQYEPQFQRPESPAQAGPANRDSRSPPPDCVAWFFRYSGMIPSARTSGPRSATKKQLQSKFVNIHLCGLKQ